MNRRSFLKGMAFVGVAAPLAPSLLKAIPVETSAPIPAVEATVAAEDVVYSPNLGLLLWPGVKEFWEKQYNDTAYELALNVRHTRERVVANIFAQASELP